MNELNEEETLAAWADVGARIEAARTAMRPKMSKRAAAAKAFISEGHWRTAERGSQNIKGHIVAPSVSPEALGDIARVVRLDPADLFRRLGWEYEPPSSERRVPEDQELEDVRAVVLAAREALGQVLGRLDAIEGRSEPGEARRASPGTR